MHIAHINPKIKTEQTVLEHNQHAANIAKLIGNEKGLEYTSYIAGLLHDMGKDTEAFDEYIRRASETPKEARRGEIIHSTTGARYIMEKFHNGSNYERLTAQLIAYAISAHHGLYDVLMEDGRDKFSERIFTDKDIHYKEAVENFSQSCSELDKLSEYFSKSCSEIQEICKKIALLGTSKEFYLGILQRMILSIIIDADRIDTYQFMDGGIQEEKYEMNNIWKELSQRMELHLSKFKNDSVISNLRSQISIECFNFATINPGIYQLPCPTGGGKTLASFRYAINHALQFNKNGIIYVAPYRAILEQNSEVIKKVFDRDDLILEHHSDIIPDDDDLYKYLTERWSNPIIFTTMVQFLNTLFLHKTQSIRRFHNLSNRIIILDEIQSLPIKCVNIFNLTMNFLAKTCGCTIILCTATQPLLDQVEHKIIMSEPMSMIANLDQKYKGFRRVNIINKQIPGGYTTENLRNLISKELDMSKSILTILNTKEAARKCFVECQNYLNQVGFEDIKLYHLTTNMCPQHRINILNEIRDMKQNQRVICISTQLIEAGVDISFETVIRSFSGLDSIAQAAGRCNRHGERDRGRVYIINSADENLSHLEDIIHGQEATALLIDLYSQDPALFDNDLLAVKAMNTYYQRYFFDRKREMNYSLKDKNTSIFELLSSNMKAVTEYEWKNQKKPQVLLRQAYETAGKSFQVIESNNFGIIVPYEEGRYIIDELNSKRQPDNLKSLLKTAQRYSVSLFQHAIKKLEEQGAIYQLNMGGVYALKEGFYNQQTGVQIEGYFESMII